MPQNSIQRDLNELNSTYHDILDRYRDFIERLREAYPDDPDKKELQNQPSLRQDIFEILRQMQTFSERARNWFDNQFSGGQFRETREKMDDWEEVQLDGLFMPTEYYDGADYVGYENGLLRIEGPNDIALRSILRGRSIDQIEKRVDDWEKFVSNLRAFIQKYDIKKNDTSDTYRYTVKGVNVVVHEYQLHGLSSDKIDTLKEKFNRFDKQLPHAIKNIRQAGFGNAVQGANLDVFYLSDKRSGGSYHTSDDRVTINLMLAPTKPPIETVVHEFGHRLSTMLPSQAVEFWIDYFNSRDLTIDIGDVRKYFETLLQPLDKAWPPSEALDDIPYSPWKVKVKKIRSLLNSSDFREWREQHYPPDKLDWIEKSKIVFHHGVDTFKKIALEYWRNEIQQVQVKFETVTEYGETNPDEFFAETFEAYVLKGRRSLPRKHRDVFEQVTRPVRT
jgi:hypothetical protein